MTRDELLQYHATLCGAARDLMELKNRDYAGSKGNEPFANFTRCEAMGICDTESGFMVRVTDKMSRLSSFLQAGKMYVSDESFNDTIVDVINYMVLLSAYASEKENKTYEESSFDHDSVVSNGQCHRTTSQGTGQRTTLGIEDC